MITMMMRMTWCGSFLLIMGEKRAERRDLMNVEKVIFRLPQVVMGELVDEVM